MSKAAAPVCLGVIGGSGVYAMHGVDVVNEHEVATPFGAPSDLVVETRIGGKSVMFLPRHGRGHTLLPSEVNSRANIFAMKKLGVSHLLAVSAVGIMREEIHPGDMVVPEQIFDRTRGARAGTFFGDGIAGHVSFADPFCDELRQIAIQASAAAGANVHAAGVYVCMEGPQFSTRSESNYYRETLNATVIGMTALPEAKLAREAELCYALLAMGTDYDCWHEEEEDVSIEAVISVLKANAEMANGIVQMTAGMLPEESDCACMHAAEYAIITAPEHISDETKKRLSVLYGRYFDGS